MELNKAPDYDFYVNVDKYYIDDIDNINLIGVIKINNETFNKIDKIILQYYGDMMYLPLILIFNNIADITNISFGTIFKLPNLNELINNIYVVDDTNENINGVSQFNLQKNQILKNIQTTALPKLNITMKKVEYDNNSGIISF